MSNGNEGKEVERQDLPVAVDAIFSGSALYANRIYVSLIVPAGVRFTFTERGEDGKEHFRTAAFISIGDALEVRDLLVKQLSTVQFKMTVADASKEESAAPVIRAD